VFKWALKALNTLFYFRPRLDHILDGLQADNKEQVMAILQAASSLVWSALGTDFGDLDQRLENSGRTAEGRRRFVEDLVRKLLTFDTLSKIMEGMILHNRVSLPTHRFSVLNDLEKTELPTEFKKVQRSLFDTLEVQSSSE